MKRKVEVLIDGKLALTGTHDAVEDPWSVYTSKYGTTVHMDVEDAEFHEAASLAIAQPTKRLREAPPRA